jgi:hypothetical protein
LKKNNVEGQRCVSEACGKWAIATVRRVNEDGTYLIEYDKKDMDFTPYWRGVTAEEISFDDERLWLEVHAFLYSTSAPWGFPEFFSLMQRLGYPANETSASEWWTNGMSQLFGKPECWPAHLDQASTYKLLLALGLSAKKMKSKLMEPAGIEYMPVYWNQTRMGGRNPKEVSRTVTCDDALAALGLSDTAEDASVAAELNALESREGIVLPRFYKDVLSRKNALERIKDLHPNNPDAVLPDADEFPVRCGLRARAIDGEYAVPFLLLQVGEWMAVFDENEADARVYFQWEVDGKEVWKLVAPSMAFFLWDYAQTGLGWYQAPKCTMSWPSERSDIGLVSKKK